MSDLNSPTPSPNASDTSHIPGGQRRRKMTPGDRSLHELNISLNITSLNRTIADKTRARKQQQEWLYTIPPGKSYAPAYYAYLCRSYPNYPSPEPSEYFVPLLDTTLEERSLAEKGFARVWQLDKDIRMLTLLAGRYGDALKDSRQVVEEEGRTLTEGLREYRGALVPLIRSPLKKSLEKENQPPALNKEEPEVQTPVLKKGDIKAPQAFLVEENHEELFPYSGWVDMMSSPI